MSSRNEKDVRHNKGHYFASKAEDANHDEMKERAYMKRQMDARRKIEDGDYGEQIRMIDVIEIDDAVDMLMKVLNGEDE